MEARGGRRVMGLTGVASLPMYDIPEISNNLTHVMAL